MRVKDAMCSEVVTIHPDATLQEAADHMLAHHVRTLLVMEEGALVGVIGLRDLFTTPRSASYGGRMTERRSEQAILDVWRAGRVRMQMNDQPIMVCEELPACESGSTSPRPVGRRPTISCS